MLASRHYLLGAALAALSVGAGCGSRICSDTGSTEFVSATKRMDCNHAPEAAIHGPASAGIGARVDLDGSASTDEERSALTPTWTLASAPPGSTARLTPSAGLQAALFTDLEGTYVVQLVVSDGEVSSAPATHTVRAENQPPVADMGGDRSVLLGGVVSLSGEGSSDPEDDALTFRWTFAERPAGSAATLQDPGAERTSFTPDVGGTYAVTLVVNDGALDSAPATGRITVTGAGHQPPVANAGADQSGTVGERATFDGSGSSDPDGDALTYQWSLVEQPSGSLAVLEDASLPTAALTPDRTGQYRVRLVVHDGQFSSAADEVVLTASAPTEPWQLGGVFDPDEVYLVGLLRKGGVQWVITHWSDPNRYTWGFSSPEITLFSGLRTDGRLGYSASTDYRLFVPDPPGRDGLGNPSYPEHPEANDTVITPPPECTSSSSKVIPATDGLWLFCYRDNLWFHEDGTVMPLRPEFELVAGHPDAVLLVGSFGRATIVHPRSGATDTPVAGLPSDVNAKVITGRVRGTGFQVVVQVVLGHNELWEVSIDGVASMLGTYPPYPSFHTQIWPLRMDAQGRLFSIGYDPRVEGDNRTIVYRMSVEGGTEIVYDERTNPVVKWGGGMMTGP